MTANTIIESNGFQFKMNADESVSVYSDAACIDTDFDCVDDLVNWLNVNGYDDAHWFVLTTLC